MEIESQKVAKVVVIGDSRIALALMESAFETTPDFHFVGFASDPLTGLEMVRNLMPDVVTIDMCMPDIAGAALLERMSAMTGVCKVMVSELISRSIALVARLEDLGASLCLNKRDVIAGKEAFLNRIRKACDRFDAAPVRLSFGATRDESSPGLITIC